ncbi:uncharacterized protein LOC135372636 isoform X2 [Ornithodoros turicata]|uniref:uncharacterized protein LOC135366715 isoform X2 n=1 Tax=Ornithodoros turicata TaxID=34597 RepID=UPI003138AECA
MYACVRYEDEVDAILPIHLIKNFNPRTTDDFDQGTTRKAFWQSKTGDGKGYYNTKVKLLGNSLGELIQDMSNKRMRIPDIIDPPECAQTSGMTSKVAKNPKVLKEKREEAQGKQLNQIMRKRNFANAAEGGSESIETVPRKVFLHEKKKRLELEQENRSLREELSAERKLCRQIQQVLLQKHATVTNSLNVALAADSLSTKSDCMHVEHIRGRPPLLPVPQTAEPLNDSSRSPDEHVFERCRSFASDAPIVPEEGGPCEEEEIIPTAVCEPAAVSKASLHVQDEPCTVHPTSDAIVACATSPQMALGTAPPTTPVQTVVIDERNLSTPQTPHRSRAAKPASRPFLGRSCAQSMPTRPSLNFDGDEVALEDNITVNKERLEWALGAAKDSLFCREVARLLWTGEELSERSVTGEACRRYAKSGAVGKKRLTPKKMDALGNAFWEYLKRTGSHEKEERFKQVTFHIRNLLSDINRKK